jgi:periplasmic protein TonB
MSTSRRMPEVARWTLCFALVLFFHVTGAAALLARWNDSPDQVANAPVITIDLAPLPASPQTEPTPAPPGPQQSEAPPSPQQQTPLEQPEVTSATAKDAELAVTPPVKPTERKPDKNRPHKLTSLASTPSPAEQKSERAAARAAGRISNDPNALPNWKSELVARLERYKRYPSDAQARNEYGVVQLAFGVDRGGGVHNARIVRSSGSAALDRATLDLIARAQPLPPPPPDIHGAQIAIVVPIRYSMR